MKVLVCKGCGERDSIVEVSLVPRIFPMAVGADGDIELDEEAIVGRGGDETFWEDESVIGYGCTNVECEHWHGNLGIRGTDPLTVIAGPWQPSDIADIVEDE